MYVFNHSSIGKHLKCSQLIEQQSIIKQVIQMFRYFNKILSYSVQKQKRLSNINKMISHPSTANIKIETQHQPSYKALITTQNTIPLNSENQINQDNRKDIHLESSIFYTKLEEKVIAGYNFQSLFRKKSHIKLARKKIKEEVEKKNSSVKVEDADKQEKHIQKGHWTIQENKLYHWFLEIHNRHFIHKHLRRADKIFKAMAKFIGTRQAEQCRSHHQKIQKKHKSFYQILLQFRLKYHMTEHHKLLRLELGQKGYNINDDVFIDAQQLKNEMIVKDQYQSEEGKSLIAVKHENLEDEGQLQPENILMGENYEKELQFKLKYQ